MTDQASCSRMASVKVSHSDVLSELTKQDIVRVNKLYEKYCGRIK